MRSPYYIFTMSHSKLGQNIRLLRKQSGLTQIDLAEKLGCTQGIITAYENDLKQPSVDRIELLAQVFQISLDTLMGREEVKTTSAPKSPRLWKKFEQLQQLPDTDKRMVFKMIDGLVAQRQ